MDGAVATVVATMRTGARNRLIRRTGGLLVAALLLGAPSAIPPRSGGVGGAAWQVSPASAAGTDPALALSAAQAFRASSGVAAVQVNGSFNFEDVLQFSFPAGVVVYQGTRFARFEMSGAVVSGSASFLADGLSAAELDTLLGLGTAAPAPAALLQLQPSRALIALPPEFSAGAASVLVYAVLENTAFLSNTVACAIPGS